MPGRTAIVYSVPVSFLGLDYKTLPTFSTLRNEGDFLSQQMDLLPSEIAERYGYV